MNKSHDAKDLRQIYITAVDIEPNLPRMIGTQIHHTNAATETLF